MVFRNTGGGMRACGLAPDVQNERAVGERVRAAVERSCQIFLAASAV